MNPPLLVLDTMVVIAAISGSTEGASAMAVRAVATGEARLAISDDFLGELVRVVGYPDVERLIDRPVRAFETALEIGTMGLMFHPRRLDWPSLRDEGDRWIFDLAYESSADHIVSFDNAVREAASELGFSAIYPENLLEILSRR